MPRAATQTVYALVGIDNFLQLQALSSIFSDLPADTQRVDVDGEQAQLAEVLDELRSFSMFSGFKVVVVRNGDALITRFREQLEKYLENPSNSAALVLRVVTLPKNQRIYKAILKIGRIIETQPPKDLARWTADQARQAHQITLAPEAAHMLADLVGADLGRIDNELAKLALQTDSGKISVEQVGASVAFQREQEMYDMTNEVAAGRTESALRRWRRLVQLDPSTEFRAVTRLTMWLENVGKALAMLQAGRPPYAICQELRIWSRELQQPFIKTVQSLGQAGLHRAIDLLAEIDRQSKSGIGDAAGNVERFLVSISAPEPRRV